MRLTHYLFKRTSGGNHLQCLQGLLSVQNTNSTHFVPSLGEGDSVEKCQIYEFLLVPLVHQERTILFTLVVFFLRLSLGLDYLPPSTNSPLLYISLVPVMIRFLLEVRQYNILSCCITGLKKENLECFKKTQQCLAGAGANARGNKCLLFVSVRHLHF